MVDQSDLKIIEAVNKILDEAKIVGGERQTYYSFISQLSKLPLICVKSLLDYYQMVYKLDRDVLEKIVVALIKA